MVWYGMWCGVVWNVMVWYGVWCGMVWCVSLNQFKIIPVQKVRLAEAREAQLQQRIWQVEALSEEASARELAGHQAEVRTENVSHGNPCVLSWLIHKLLNEMILSLMN